MRLTSRSTVNGFAIAEDSMTGTSNMKETHSPAEGRATSPQSQPQWSSAVGKANLGKSGRVIEKLMAENDALKRELKFEKLKSEEAKEAIKMAETKLQQKMAEVETELHDATIAKAQLKRSDRRLADLKAAMDGERQRVVAANEAARAHQERADTAIKEAQSRVDFAENHRLMTEGSYNTFRNHYKDEKEMARRIVDAQKYQVDEVLEQKREDARRMAKLYELIDSQNKHIALMNENYQAVVQHHDAYRKEQEADMSGIKTKAREQLSKNEGQIEESAEVLGRLKWALQIQEDRNAGLY